MSDDLRRAAEAREVAMEAMLRALSAEREARAYWLEAEFDAGPEASEGKAAMRKVAHEQAEARARAAGRVFVEAHEAWQRLGGTMSEAEHDEQLRRVHAAPEADR